METLMLITLLLAAFNCGLGVGIFIFEWYRRIIVKRTTVYIVERHGSQGHDYSTEVINIYYNKNNANQRCLDYIKLNPEYDFEVRQFSVLGEL